MKLSESNCWMYNFKLLTFRVNLTEDAHQKTKTSIHYDSYEYYFEDLIKVNTTPSFFNIR